MSEASVKIKQLTDKDGALIAGYTPALGVYFSDGKRLTTKIAAIDTISAETINTLTQYKTEENQRFNEFSASTDNKFNTFSSGMTNNFNSFSSTTNSKVDKFNELNIVRFDEFSASTNIRINQFESETEDKINAFSGTQETVNTTLNTKVTNLENKTEDITKETSSEGDTSVVITTDGGVNVINIDDSGIAVNGSIKKNGVEVATQDSIDELEFVVYPLTLDSYSANTTTVEVGTIVTPSVKFNVTRHKVGIASQVSYNIKPTPTSSGITADNKTYTFQGAPLSAAGTTNYSINVSQSFNGDTQTATPGTPSYTFTNYRYYGEVSSVPTDYPTAIKALSTKELSTTSTLTGKKVSANKYYLFAVKGNKDFYCYISGSTTKINGCITGTCSVKQENYTTTNLENTYSYVLVPASTTAWTFDITNSEK